MFRLVAKLLVVGLVVFLISQLYFSRSTDKGVTIQMTANGFEPKEVTIATGEKVTFENADKSQHWPATNIHPTHRLYPGSDVEKCDTDEEVALFDACGGLDLGESYSFTFDKPGKWRFHDHLNPSLKGLVTVVGESEDDIVIEKEIIDYTYDEGIAKDSTNIFTDDNALYSYTKKYGPKVAVQQLAGLNSLYGDCHTRSHEAGRMAYQLFDNEAFQTCSAECHSGCYHGATEAFFRDHGVESLQKNIKTICSSELNSFFSHQCIHGIGHGLMAFSDYDIHEALADCDLLDNSRESCYSGVFMENIVGGLTEDHATEYLSDDPHFPCTVVGTKYRSGCYFYQTSRMIVLFSGDFAKVAEACFETSERYHQSCFESMGRDVGGAFRGDSQGAIEACSQTPEGNPRLWCLGGAIQDSFWDPDGQDAALEFCTMLSEHEEKSYCYTVIFSRAPQVLQTKDELSELCKKVEKDYLQDCLGLVK